MIVKISDFEEVRKLSVARKSLMECITCIDESDYASASVRGKEKMSVFGGPRVYFDNNERLQTIKQLMHAECEEQLAEVNRKIAKYGIDVDD